jgi:hypothetical protein
MAVVIRVQSSFTQSAELLLACCERCCGELALGWEKLCAVAT